MDKDADLMSILMKEISGGGLYRRGGLIPEWSVNKKVDGS
jgi:hypothetical protein